MKLHKQGFTLVELLVVISIIGLVASIVLASVRSAGIKARDSKRISGLRQLTYALALYYDKFGQYPTCLQLGGSCTTTLLGSGFISAIQTDPLTGLSYSYAANGANCTGYHLGISLEDKTNKVLLTGADAAPRLLCTGSAADFHGLSSTAGGQLCNSIAGTAQPTAAVDGESCYDVSE
jgi:prepilin-type N-terminal cleavage/methylation domain-containing protein